MEATIAPAPSRPGTDDTGDSLLVDTDALEAWADGQRRVFRRALPGAHAVVPALPGDSVSSELVSRLALAGPAPGERQRFREFPPLLRELVWELGSGSFMRCLRTLTGVGNLVPDPVLEEGGLVALAAGQRAVTHIQAAGPRNRLRRVISLLLWWPSAGFGDGLHLSLRGETGVGELSLLPGQALLCDSDLLARAAQDPISEGAAVPGWLLHLHYYLNPESLADDRALFPPVAGRSAGA